MRLVDEAREASPYPDRTVAGTWLLNIVWKFVSKIRLALREKQRQHFPQCGGPLSQLDPRFFRDHCASVVVRLDS